MNYLKIEKKYRNNCLKASRALGGMQAWRYWRIYVKWD